MKHFNSGFNDFFKELAANNHKEWFDANRKRYLKEVKQPFEDFVQAYIEVLLPLMPGIEREAKKAIFRINRDIRFSKDKTPYKLHSAAYLSPYGKKDPYSAGIYFQFGPEHVMIAAGLYQPDNAQLKRVRHSIAANPTQIEALTNTPAFKKYFGEIKGEENKRINDPELAEAAVKYPLLMKKQMYFEALHEHGFITNPDLLAHMLDHYMAAAPLVNYFKEILLQED